jgi:DNA-binding MarR family transcriptional regulator
MYRYTNIVHRYTIVKERGRSVAIGAPVGTMSRVARRDVHEFYDRLGAVLRRLRSATAQAYADFEVGSAQAKILRHIHRDRGISQAELARATDTAPTLTGRALETLVERGWVRRRRSDEDRREYLIELTASGQRMRDKVEQAREGIIRRIATVLDDRDFEDFDRIAGKILAALEQPGEPREQAARR